MIKVEINQGSEDSSAPQSKLAFTFEFKGYSSNSIELLLNFENPLSISSGKQPDILQIKFLEPELFVSKETGKSIVSDTIITYAIPK